MEGPRQITDFADLSYERMIGNTMNHKLIVEQLERAYSTAESELEQKARELGAMHGSVMPRTYVGAAYGQAEFHGRRVPKVFVMSINQSRRGQDLTDDEIRQSMRNILRDETGRFLPDGFGPRALAANLTRWILMQCGFQKDALEPGIVHDLIAYDNFVKWPFDVSRSQPAKEAWSVFYEINRNVIEILQPDIVLSLGRPMYDHIWNAMKDRPGYSWEPNVPSWCFSILGPDPGRRCELGWCYHYSNAVSPNRIWRELREKGKLPKKALRLLGDQKLTPEALTSAMQMIDEDEEHHPWWGEETYSGTSFTRYNPYQKFLAWHVCRSLVRRWQATSAS